MLLKNKNFIMFDCSSNSNVFKIESTFNLNNLNLIFNNWNLHFFKFKSLNLNVYALNLYKNSFVSFFFNLNHLFYFFKYNYNILFVQNLKLLNICYNGFFLNLNFFYNLKFNYFSNIYLFFFFELYLNIIFNLLYLYLFKLMYILYISIFQKKNILNNTTSFFLKKNITRSYKISNKNYKKNLNLKKNIIYFFNYIFLFFCLLFFFCWLFFFFNYELNILLYLLDSDNEEKEICKSSYSIITDEQESMENNIEKIDNIEKINEFENNKTFFQEYKSYFVVGTIVFSVVTVVAGLYYFDYLNDIFSYFQESESSSESSSEDLDSSDIADYVNKVIHENSSEYFIEESSELSNEFTEADRASFIDAYGDPFDYQREADPTNSQVENVSSHFDYLKEYFSMYNSSIYDNIEPIDYQSEADSTNSQVENDSPPFDFMKEYVSMYNSSIYDTIDTTSDQNIDSDTELEYILDIDSELEGMDWSAYDDYEESRRNI